MKTLCKVDHEFQKLMATEDNILSQDFTFDVTKRVEKILTRAECWSRRLYTLLRVSNLLPSAYQLWYFQVILQQMELITSADVIRNLCKKMAPPLVTLISAEPEIQYVALRNINLIVQRRPNILAHEIKVMHQFFETHICSVLEFSLFKQFLQLGQYCDL